MRTLPSLILSLMFATFAMAQAPQPSAAAAATAPAQAAPPPAGPVKRSAAELEKLVAPIALYPDPLIATLLPASVYPLEIVQAARFVANTNNLANLDAQPWDANVKAVARVPEVIKKMNDELQWTMELGDAFLAQDKDVMDAIQSMRGMAQKAGTLQTTQQQIVVVTNMVVETRVEQQVVVVTNTVVQIQPTNPQVVYVPTYNPTVVYYPPPSYVYNPVAPLVTFGVGMMVGAAIANNNCDWHGGGCYHGDVDINVNRNVNINQNANINRTGTASGTRATGAQASSASAQNKWQPDQSRLSKSGSPTAANSARSTEARGWSSGGAKPSTAAAGARPSTGAAGARPTTGTAAARPSTGASGARPSTGTPSAASRPSAAPTASRPSPTPSATPSRPSPSASPASRPSPSGSAFGGVNSGAAASSQASRGAASRSSGGGGGGGARGGGGGRGGGGRR